MKFKSIGTAILISVLSLSVAGGCLVGCKKKGEPDPTEGATPLEWSDGYNEKGEYDNSLFYSNDFESLISTADPFILYEDGWFYMYYTETSGGVLEGYRSRNFANWEYLGVIFRRSSSYWGVGRFWAPKVVKNPLDGKFYMYTCCSADSGSVGFPEGTTTSNSAAVTDRLYLTVLVADSPAGPFREWTGYRPNFVEYFHGEPTGTVGDEVTLTSGPMFDFAQAPAGWETNRAHYEKNGTNIFAQLDAFPFFDDNGDFYLYFIRSRDMNDETGKQGAWGVKMIDMVTPDFTTLTCLTQPGFLTPGGERSTASIDDNTVNEGCFVQSHVTVDENGNEVKKYYLTYSRSGYGDKNYSACLAVADSPLGYPKGSSEAPNGGFVKLDPLYGNPVHMINGNYDMYEATGNAMFFKAGGEEFLISLATVYNRTTPSASSRNFIIDRVTWSYNEELGYDIPHSNGPTQASLQPAPSTYSGYKNIAGDAKITVTNARDGMDTSLLTDGFVAIHGRDEEMEFRTKDGGSTITLEFPEARPVRSVMVYNSQDIQFAFNKIKDVTLVTEEGSFFASDVAYPEKFLTGKVELGGGLRPGGAAVVEFSEKKVQKIIIRINDKYTHELDDFGEEYQGLGISEICVLGRDADAGEAQNAAMDTGAFQGSGIVGIPDLLDMVGYGSMSSYEYDEEGGVALQANFFAPLRGSNAEGAFVAEATISRADGVYDVMTEAANTGAISVLTEHVRHRIYVVGVDDETSYIVVNGAQKQAYGNNYDYFERRYPIPLGGYCTGAPIEMQVVYYRNTYYIKLETNGSTVFTSIDRNTDFIENSSFPSTMSEFFAEGERTLCLESLDLRAHFGNISFTLGESAESSILRTQCHVSTTNSSPEGGMLTVSDPNPMRGKTVLVTLKPNGGYYLDKFTVNGVDMKGKLSLAEDGAYQYSIIAIQEDTAIRATYKAGVEEKYLVTGSYSYSSGVYEKGIGIINEGDEITVTAGIYTGTAQGGHFEIELPNGRFTIELQSEMFPAATKDVFVHGGTADAGDICFKRINFDPVVSYNANDSVTFSASRTTRLFENVSAEEGFVVNFTVTGGTTGWFRTGGLVMEYDTRNSAGIPVVYYDYIFFYNTGSIAEAVLVQSSTRWDNGPVARTTYPYADLLSPLKVTVAYYDGTFHFILDDIYVFRIDKTSALDRTQGPSFDADDFFGAKTRRLGLRSYDSAATFADVSYQLGDDAAQQVIAETKGAVTATAGEGGNVSVKTLTGAAVPSGTIYDIGTEVVLTVTPEQGKFIQKLTLNGEDKTSLLSGPFKQADGTSFYKLYTKVTRNGLNFHATFKDTEAKHAVTGKVAFAEGLSATNVTLQANGYTGTVESGNFSIDLPDGTFVLTFADEKGNFATKEVTVAGKAVNAGIVTIVPFGLTNDVGLVKEGDSYTLQRATGGIYHPLAGDIVASEGFAVTFTVQGSASEAWYNCLGFYFVKNGVTYSICIRDNNGEALVGLLQSDAGTSAGAMYYYTHRPYNITEPLEISIVYYREVFYIAFGDFAFTVSAGNYSNSVFSHPEQITKEFFTAGYRSLGFRAMDTGGTLSNVSYVLGDEATYERMQTLGYWD